MANAQEQTFTMDEIREAFTLIRVGGYWSSFRAQLEEHALEQQVEKDLAEAKTVQELQLIIIKNHNMEFLLWGTEYITLKAFMKMIEPIATEVNTRTIFEEYSGFKVPNFKGRVKQSKKIAITDMLAAKKELSAK